MYLAVFLLLPTIYDFAPQDPQVTSTLQSVELLDLSYNDVMWIDSDVLMHAPQLTTLSLAGNPFLCTCPMAPFVHTLRSKIKGFFLCLNV